MKELLFALLKDGNLCFLWRLLTLGERIPKILYIVSWNLRTRVLKPCVPFCF